MMLPRLWHEALSTVYPLLTMLIAVPMDWATHCVVPLYSQRNEDAPIVQEERAPIVQEGPAPMVQEGRDPSEQ
jgi:hypothetical protein